MTVFASVRTCTAAGGKAGAEDLVLCVVYTPCTLILDAFNKELVVLCTAVDGEGETVTSISLEGPTEIVRVYDL